MAMRLESTSGGPMGSGFLPVHEGSQPPAPRVLASRAHLPERYGVPLLELLVVDPYFIFISWEIAQEQLDQARQHLGESFEQRRLSVALIDAQSEQVVSTRELYGEVGRWFIQLNAPGRWIRAELHFRSVGAELSLNRAGPVFVPRDRPVEPEHWEELHVNYSRGEKGELRIESLGRQQADGWPKIALEGPAGLDQPAAQDGSASRFSSPGGAQRHIDAALLRPLLPVAPAALEDDDD
jgi:hypothetical protein